jgi:pilus assembly protein CpaE
MHIAIISPSTAHLEDIQRHLQGAGHVAVAAEGGKSRIDQVLGQSQPELLIVDGMCCDPAELEHVEKAMAQHPQLMVALLCSQQTPEFLIRAMRAGVREVLPSPPPASQLLAAVGRLACRVSPPARHGGQGKLLAFMPCKGGSGASFLAANLGWQLGQSGKALLIDLNLQFGDALSLVHEDSPPFTLADVARDIHRLDAALLAACSVQVTPGLSVLAAPQEVGDAVDIKPDQIEALIQVARQAYDFVLLDLGRSLDHMNVRALDQADQIFMVLQSGLPWLRHAKRMQRVFRSLDYPDHKIEWIVNRFEKNADIGLEEIARALGTERLRPVANSYREVSASINQGAALMANARASTVTRDLVELALKLSPPPAQPSRSLLGRLFRRA